MAFWDAKWRRAFAGRRGVLDRVAQWGAAHRDRSRPLLWMHASSVGEGLQARAVLECVRRARPDVQIAYTHFSPSAESFAKSLVESGLVDVGEYLPLDTPWGARGMLDALAPTALFFAKLDLWPVLTAHAARRNVHLGMISATLAATSSRRGWLASRFLRGAYARLRTVGAIAQDDLERLVEMGVPASAITVTGDTRYDQVWARAAGAAERARGIVGAAQGPGEARVRPARPSDSTNDDQPSLTLVAGSTWPPDERILLEALNTLRAREIRLQVILAPHEPTEAHLRPIERWAADHGVSCARLSALGKDRTPEIVLVDRTGVLADLYALGDLAYVGGGFHAAGLHSVLEPAACGVPVLMGPGIEASRDAKLLLEARAAHVVRTAAELTTQCLTWTRNSEARASAGIRARELVRQGLGAAERSAALVMSML